jgi:phosphonate degradation associated HDIG domain protein
MTQDEALAAEIHDILEVRAEGRYGLCDVTQKQHALQAAWLAEREGQGSAMIAAALLHDIGHLIHDLGDDPADAGLDDRHEELGHAWLARHFGAEVSEPVRMHVAAKRYLCAAEPDYFGKLSADSVRSLGLQGGPMSAAEAAAFRVSPHAAAAVQLRRYDEMAKVAGLKTPGVAHFLPHVAKALANFAAR